MAIHIGSIDKKSVDELKKILKMLRSEYAKTKNCLLYTSPSPRDS